MNLAEFLLARVAEDEDDARREFEFFRPPQFTLAECEAKRSICRMFQNAERAERAAPVHSGARNAYREERAALQRALEALALPYSSHPDFANVWVVRA